MICLGCNRIEIASRTLPDGRVVCDRCADAACNGPGWPQEARTVTGGYTPSFAGFEGRETRYGRWDDAECN